MERRTPAAAAVAAAARGRTWPLLEAALQAGRWGSLQLQWGWRWGVAAAALAAAAAAALALGPLEPLGYVCEPVKDAHLPRTLVLVVGWDFPKLAAPGTKGLPLWWGG